MISNTMMSSWGRGCVLTILLTTLTWSEVNPQRTCTGSAQCVFQADTGKTDCESRQLTCIPTQYPRAVIMMLAQNSLQMVPRGIFSNYRMMRKLDMSNNAIYSIDNGAFGGLGGVTSLNIANNRMTQLTAGTFGGLRGLQILHLQGNAIDTVDAQTFRELTNLMELNLAGNRLSILPPGLFSPLVSLKRMFLQENQLTTNPNTPFLNGLSSLVELDLDGNRFNNIPSMSGLVRLTDLDITDTHITVIRNGSFASLRSVRDIILSNNMISMIEEDAFTGLNVLTELDLAFNVLTYLPIDVFQSLYNMERLQLQNNQLHRLTTQHFAAMTRLTSLNLEGNQLTAFPPMPHFRMLDTLNLKSNRLDTFEPRTMQSMPLVKRLFLVGNPLQCDCRLVRLRQMYLTATNPAPYHPNEIPTCNAQEPRQLRGTRLTAVQPAHLRCHPPVLQPFKRTIATRSGMNATLTCSSSGFPAPNVMWVAPNGLRLRQNTQHPNQRIRVTEDGMMLVAYASMADEGAYSCIMANPAGQVQAAVRLVVQPPPPPPEIPITTNTNIYVNHYPPEKPSTHNPQSPQITSNTNTQEIPTNGNPYRPTTLPHFPRREENNGVNVYPPHNPHVNHTSTHLNPTIVIASPDTPYEEPTEPRRPQCSNIGSGGLVAAVLLTFLFTASLTGILFFLWYRRWLPLVMLSGRKKGILTLSGRRRLSSKVPRQTQISNARRLRSYERVDESRGPSSYFSDSEDTLSTASSYDSARYVITDNSVTDPDSIRIRQIRLAAVSAKAPRGKLIETVRLEGTPEEGPPTVARTATSKTTTTPKSTMKLPGALAALKNKATGRKTHIYQNADMVVHDPNYSALWPGPKQGQYQYPRKHSGESRIYVDLS